MGEQIDAELRFESTTPGRYRVFSAGIDRRYARDPEYDSFTAEPAADARDPLFDSGTLMAGAMIRGFGCPALGATPLVAAGIVNDWISFRKPGTYRIRAESARVYRGEQAPERIRLVSNAIEIEIVAPEAGWRERQLKAAVAVLESARSQTTSENHEAIRRAARILRFLETREAVPHLVRFFEQGPPDAQQDIRAGLMASPHRAEVIAAMEQAIEAPDAAITGYWMGTLMQIEYARRFGPRGDPIPRNDPEALKRWMEADRGYMERFTGIQEHYNGRLAGAVWRKRGAARAISLEALLGEGSPALRNEVRQKLAAEFAALPDSVQLRLLMRWQEIGGPELEPALISLAEKPGMARNAALDRLLELNPAAARRIILARIRSGDLGDPRSQQPQAFLFLPDERLPELDNSLVEALDKGTLGPALVARYATDAALRRVLGWLERNPQAICYTAISAYLFRVFPARAASVLAEARRRSGGCGLNLPQNAAYLVMSPGLERAAIGDLSNDDPIIRRAAQTILQHAGSGAAEQPLWEAFARMREKPAAPMEEGIETGFVDALIQRFGWVLTPEKLDALERTCATARCRDFARSQRRFLDRPITISTSPQGPWHVMVGGCLTFTPKQTLEKIRQFPRGTAFRLPRAGRQQGEWFWRTRTEELRKLLNEASMTTVDIK
jgi:hypothetical protein